MTRFRLTSASLIDIAEILRWSHNQFGETARTRYEALISTAIKEAAGDVESGRRARAELGEGVFTWHLTQSRKRSPRGLVQRPRHLLVCRMDDDVMVVGRVLHDAMELGRHLDDQI